MQITHTFVSAITEGSDPTLVGPNEWNATHSLSFSGTTVSSGSSATMTATQDVLEVNVTSAFTANLPSSPVNWKEYTVIDVSGSPNITVSPVSYTIGAPYGSWVGYYNGSAWRQKA